ncbi:MAG: OmpA family protein [Spirochaetes bacterium]|nr:OmpA family protein [Spirochaetota bacterium]
MKSCTIVCIAVLTALLSAALCGENIVENLGSNINSAFDELAPVISPDGKTLYFVRQNHPENGFGAEPSLAIWYSEQDTNGKWMPAIRMEAPLNTVRFNSVFSVTPDGQTLLILGAYKAGEYIAPGFSFAQKLKGGWGLPEQINMPAFIDPEKSKVISASLANDGKAIVISYCDNTEWKNDLFVTFKSNDVWTAPKDLGVTVNSEGNEITPFLASDGVTLFFSSDKSGNADIYMTKRLDKSWKKWSKPKRLGAPINSEAWEAYYTVDAKGEFAYMVSWKNTIGKGDIVRIKVQEDSMPDPVVLVTGTVHHATTKEPIEASIKYTILPAGENAGNAASDARDGRYKIVLPYGKTYSFLADAPGYIAVSQNLDLTKISTYKEIVQNLALVPIEVGQTIVLNSIFFDYNKASLRSESFPELDRVVQLLKENATMEIEVAGHTDSTGDAAYNQKLSQERAQAVKTYIASKRITETRVSVKGYGKAKPVASNDTEAGRQQNRRVEFSILKK